MDHSEGLHEHCFWLYGVFVGLAIQQALMGIAPHLINPPEGTRFEDAVRLGIFLLLIVRFYLGAAHFFRAAYTGATASKYENKNYFSDFLFGIVHFLIFFALAATLDYHGPKRRAFLVVLIVVLVYDIPWFLFRLKQSTRYLIKMWAVMNGITVIAGVSLYLLAKVADIHQPFKEELAFAPIVVMSIIDYAELKSGNRIFATWLSRLAFDPYNPPPATEPESPPAESINSN